MGKMSRRKGASGEREFRDLLREYGFEAERAGRQGLDADIRHSIPGYHFEVKRCEKFDMGRWITQARGDMLHFGKRVWAVAHRRSHDEWMVTLPARELLSLLASRPDV